VSGGAAIDDTGAALLEQIAGSPDDPDPYLVYADWLSGSADPIAQAHGALIALQHRLPRSASTSAAPELRAEEARLLEQLVPALAPLQLGEDDRLTWRWGFIHRAVICDPHFRRPARPASAALVEALLAAPAARFLRQLDVAAHRAAELAQIAARLGELHPPALRSLGIHERFPDSDDLVAGIVLDCAHALWPLALDELRLCAGSLVLGPIDAPALRRIELEGGLDATALEALAQLVELDLAGCGITAAGARRLEQLPRIDRIDLSDNPLGEAALASARARWPGLVHDPDADSP
jgi:uncharacterized protein (TIGR02996 family)